MEVQVVQFGIEKMHESRRGVGRDPMVVVFNERVVISAQDHAKDRMIEFSCTRREWEEIARKVAEGGTRCSKLPAGT